MVQPHYHITSRCRSQGCDINPCSQCEHAYSLGMSYFSLLGTVGNHSAAGFDNLDHADDKRPELR